ncbi:M23 family metallopeptidase [Blastomonas sp.]|uniref:M23 family metallopeptidase n=1 Tax=Blastomonas sp. TaxID=1909299 RepID=UPI002628CA97|nr:M23 family metallopeptidase [Blastomonas sp.]MDM7955536.1 M23 family metallopeptidase [Blastomonas sp.]
MFAGSAGAVLAQAGPVRGDAAVATSGQASGPDFLARPFGAVRPLSSGIRLSGPPVQGALLRGKVPTGVVALDLDGVKVPLAEDGEFLLGFHRDAPTLGVLTVNFADGTVMAEPLAIEPRSWRREFIAIAARGGVPSEAFMARRKPELEMIAAARLRASDSTGWRQPFIWPATGRVSGIFGSQRVYAGEPGAFHSGVDVAGPTGTPIVAPADGVVILAAPTPFSLEGNLLMIDHGMGLNSAFLHLSSIDVKDGERVRQGQQIGRIGATGRATGPHLHWSMKWNDARIDPQNLVPAMSALGK